MINKKQRKAYTSLHDQLTEVHERKEINREETVTIYAEVKQFYDHLKNGYEAGKSYLLKNPGVPFNQAESEQHIADTMSVFQPLLYEFQAYIQENIEVFKIIEECMKDMIVHNKKLGQQNTTVDEADLILAKMKSRIDLASYQLDQKIEEFNELKQRFSKIKSDFYSPPATTDLSPAPHLIRTSIEQECLDMMEEITSIVRGLEEDGFEFDKNAKNKIQQFQSAKEYVEGFIRQRKQVEDLKNKPISFPGREEMIKKAIAAAKEVEAVITVMHGQLQSMLDNLKSGK